MNRTNRDDELVSFTPMMGCGFCGRLPSDMDCCEKARDWARRFAKIVAGAHAPPEQTLHEMALWERLVRRWSRKHATEAGTERQEPR